MEPTSLVKVNVRLSKEQLAWLKEKSAACGSNYNYFVRLAVDNFIAAYEAEEADLAKAGFTTRLIKRLGDGGSRG